MAQSEKDEAKTPTWKRIRFNAVRAHATTIICYHPPKGSKLDKI
jgi:hypothetical protein